MEENMNSQQGQPSTTVPQKIQLPNSTGILVMGIMGIVCFCCIAAGIAGIILSILAIVYGNKAINQYYQNPQLYTEASFKNAKAGRVCGIVGACIGGVYLIAVLVWLSMIGWAVGTIFTTMPWHMIN